MSPARSVSGNDSDVVIRVKGKKQEWLRRSGNKFQAKLKRLGRDMRKLTKKMSVSSALLATTIHTTVLPMVAAVVYKGIFRTGMGYRKPMPQFCDSRPGLLK